MTSPNNPEPPPPSGPSLPPPPLSSPEPPTEAPLVPAAPQPTGVTPSRPGTPSALDLSQPQRQSPLAVLFLVLRFVRSVGVVQIFVGAGFVLSRSPSILVVGVGVLLIASVLLVISGLSWWRYTFAITEGELRVEQGVISKQRLSIPLDRVQSVSIQQKLLHRIVDLVQVSADSAGTSSSEFTIDAVKRPVAEALQAAAADHRAHAAASSAPGSVAVGPDGVMISAPSVEADKVADRVILRRTPGELMKIALTQFPLSGLVVLAPLFAFSGQILDRLPSMVPEPEISFAMGRWLLWAIPVFFLGIVVFSVLLNIVRVFLTDWGLTVTQTAAGLRKNSGLFSKRSTAASLPRLQLVRVSQSPLMKLAGISNVSLIGIRSSVAVEGATGGGGTILVPGSGPSEIAELRRLGLDGAQGVPELDRLVSPLEVFKQTRNMTVVALLPAIGLLWSPIGWWSLLFLALVPWRWLVVRRQTRLRRWGVSADAIANQTELLTRDKNEALLRKMNSVTVQQSLFERKRGLATLSISLAGAAITIGMIPVEEARAVRDGALYVAETDRRAFM